MAVSMAVVRVLEAKGVAREGIAGVRRRAFAGRVFGALRGGRVLDLADTAKLLRTRGEAMQAGRARRGRARWRRSSGSISRRCCAR